MADPVLISKENGVSKFRGEGTISEAFGKPVNKSYTYEFETYESKAAAVSANKWPADADQYVLAKINKQNEASAKSAAYQAELKEEKAAYEQSDEFKFKQLISSLVVAGQDEKAAREIALSLMPQMK